MGLLQSASKTILRIDVFFLLLLGFSMYFLEPGQESYVTAQLTLIPVALSFLMALAVIYTGWDPFEE